MATQRTPITTLLSVMASLSLASLGTTALAGPVPGFVAPVTQTPVAAYVDDTRGLYLPEHAQLRSKTMVELANWQQPQALSDTGSDNGQALNRIATGEENVGSALDRIASNEGMLAGQGVGGSMNGVAMAQNYMPEPGNAMTGTYAQPRRSAPQDMMAMPSLATGGQPRMAQMMPQTAPQMAPQMMPGAQPNKLMVPEAEPMAQTPMAGEGQEIAVGSAMNSHILDLENSVVRIREERITVRRALQRMLDQVGGSGWTVVWDLDEVNVALPEMEISLYTEEPFMNVLNALLARLQSRSGQPLRVIKYDQTQRVVITDRATAASGTGVGPGADAKSKVAVTETVLKEARVSLHYDEIPLVDALENMVNQAGDGQWRLRMYAGSDQVLKPAHIEEPFGVAIERVLKVFNLRYEIFPGGKLVVVTAGDAFGFRGVQ